MKNETTSSASGDRLRKRVLLLGRGIGKSISPAILQKAFTDTGFAAEYELLDLEDSEFQPSVEKIRASPEIIGFNVTIPYKERILPSLQTIDKRAKEVGAVNTVKFDAGRNMSGFNTDVDGIIASFSRLSLSDARNTVILGAGGAARACVYSAASNGFKRIAILNRTDARGVALATEFGSKFPAAEIESSELSKEIFDFFMKEGCDLLINTIPPENLPFITDLETAPRSMKYFELSYCGGSTLLKVARTRGLVAMDGLLMLVEQAAKSFEIWTGIPAPRKAMLLAAESQVSSRERAE
jgi:shikimate dehydrogenase